MTLRKATGLTKVSRATAWRDLAELVELQAIEPIGEGRSRAYRLRWAAAGASAVPSLGADSPGDEPYR